jgi:hypothetical protein
MTDVSVDRTAGHGQTTRAWAKPHHIGRQCWFGLPKLAPVVLPQQLECQVGLIGQAQAAHGVRDRGLLGDHSLYVLQPRPCRTRRQ